MSIEKVNTPWITVSHVLTTIGLVGGMLAFANSAENQSVETSTKQEAIQKTQEEMKIDFKAYQAEQRQVQTEQMKLLHQIKGRLEK